MLLADSPSPTPDPARIITSAQEGGWVAVALLVVFALIGAGLTWAILYSAKYPKPTMLILTLSIITLGLVGIYTIYGNARSEVLPLASAALGALVASVSGNQPPSPPGGDQFK